MPRRNHPRRSTRSHAAAGPPLPASVGQVSSESGPDGDWLVRSVPGAQAVKTYRCPGCDHEIRPGTPHIVAWPADEYGTVADRRHWHRGCWQARTRRGPPGRR